MRNKQDNISPEAENLLYDKPNTGCLIGTAFQTLFSRLNDALLQSGLDITVAEYMVLRALYQRDGQQQCDLAEAVGKDKGAISRCVAAMARKGLVKIESVSHKCRNVYLAERGRLVEPAVMTIAAERHEAITSVLSPREIDNLHSALSKIITLSK